MEKHDSSYRQFFSSPRMVKDLLVGFIDESWVDELNFDVMEPVETSFVSDALRTREADVVWRIRWRDRWLYVYVLIEMQSSVDSMMAVRLLSYVSLLYQDLIARKELTDNRLLPPVFPITLYNGNTPWTAARSLSDLVEPAPKSLRRYQPQFEYFVLDEGRLPKNVPKSLPNLVSSLITMDNGRNIGDIERGLGEVINWLQQDDAGSRKLRRTFLVWLGRSLLPARFPGVEVPKLRNLLEAKDMLSERVVEWTKEWKQEGLELGLERGLERGAAETAERMLLEDFSVDVISRMTGLSVEYVEALKPKH